MLFSGFFGSFLDFFVVFGGGFVKLFLVYLSDSYLFILLVSVEGVFVLCIWYYVRIRRELAKDWVLLLEF